MGDQRCAACGGVLDRDAVFCGTCGARVMTLAAPSGPAAPPWPPVPTARQVPAAPPVPPVAPAADPQPVATGVPIASDLPAPHRAASTEAPAVRPVGAGPVEWSLGADVDDAVAPIGRRLLALLVDQVLAALVIGAGGLAVLPALRDGGADASLATILVPGMLAVLLAAGQWLAEAFAGCTVGSALLSISTVSVRTGRPAGLWAVLVRSVVQSLGSLLAGVGVYLVAASGAWDEGPEQRGWHDKAARTMVLRAAYLSGRRGRKDGAAGSTAAAASTASPAVGAPDAPSATATATTGAPVRVPGPGPTSGPPVPGGPATGSSTVVSAPVAAAPVAAADPGAEVVREPAVVVPTYSALTPPDPAPVPTALVPTAPVPVAAAPTPVLPDLGGTGAGDDLPDRTVPTVPLPGDLEHTRVGGWTPRAEATGAGSALRLLFDTGEQVDVRGPGLIGRRPDPGEGVWAHLVAVADPDQSVSKTHLAFWPDGEGLVVTDRGSTNGTVLIDPAGSRWVLPPEEPAVVAAGWSLVLGQRTVRVEAL
ncbi:MAG TPA: RDD family protein [Cellulomonas sp.]